MKNKIAKKKLADYENDDDFGSWYCYMEDKWLQYAGWEEKLTAVFGSVDNAIEKYEKYIEKEGKFESELNVP